TSGWRKPNPEARDRLGVQAATFEIVFGSPALRGGLQLLGEKHLRFAVHFNQRRTLLILSALFRRTLLGLRDRDAALLCHHADSFRKGALFHFHHEREYVATLTATETMKNLFYRMNRKRWRFFAVKWTEPSKILAALFEAHIFADHAHDVRLLLYPIRE